MPYTSKAVANYFLDLAKRDGKLVDPMKLQKLVYFAHGWNLAISGKPLLADTVEAWQFGPVIPDLYHEFKHFGRNPVTDWASTLTSSGKSISITFDSVPESDANVRALLDRVWQVYGNLSGIELSNRTHDEGSPWDLTWQRAGGRKNVDIEDAMIRDYFKDKLVAAGE